MSRPATKQLVRALDAMRQDVRYPYGLFVTEALRSFGVQVNDDEPHAELRAGVAAAVEAYRAAVLEEDPFRDVLGPIYQDEASKGHRDMSGQFFTPWDLCLLIADMQLGDWKPGPSPAGGLWTLQEPACGSGAMLLAAFAGLVKRWGPEALLFWHVEAVDLDLTCARTCALQVVANLSLRGWSVGRMLVHHGDTLRMEFRSVVLHATNGEDPEALPRMWGTLEMLAAVARVETLVREALPEPDPVEDPDGQFRLFGEEAA